MKKKNELADILIIAKMEALKTALEDILKIEYTLPAVEGEEKLGIDYEFTVRMIRSRARMTLDVVKGMDNVKSEVKK